MTDAEVIQKALSMLASAADTSINTAPVDDVPVIRTIGPELAALIRKAAEPLRYRHADDVLQICHICRSRAHAPDCALIALCKAIVGETP